ncbi:MAG: molybdopterin-dependent oxidoreductase [Candidatus Cloacimonetes bacterium]|jgi:CO/xanthine dehydrogenase Mo-binding subunit/CO/xanthine dehydrogenase FAD-binding subunit|nr:molybdopterin-dependent oxidoreductase [Candidatus Cloacimonadota bacterium]
MANIIGKKVIRVDAYEKVTGKAIYGDDIKLVDMLHAAVRYTDIPVGKITKIDCSKAEKVPGVVRIALFKDIPGQTKLGPIRSDQYAIVENEVFFSGDVIAVVAAETKEIALNATDLIHVEYEPIKGIFDPRVAIKPDARLIHPEYKSNVVLHYPLRKGNIDKGFVESDHVIEREYQTGFHEHAYIEPETVTAVPDHTSRGFKIYGSIQNPFTTRKVVALFMGLNMNQINIFGSTLGGSFGGKDDIINYMACRCALLSKLTGKPVKLTYTRENSIKESYKRHPYYMKYKVGFNNNGKLKAMKINIIADSGAYSSQTFFVTWRSVVQATGPYEIENVETDIKGVYTNNTYTAAFRGFGSPQVIFAQESLMDEIAEICGISTLEVRKLNGFKQGSTTASGQVLNKHTVSLDEVIDKAVLKADYNKKLEEYKKLNEQNGRYKYGIGFACSYRGCALGAEGTDATSAIVSVQADGSIYVLTGMNENGQGMRTTFSQVTAEVLGTDLEKIVFLEPQTATITDGGPTVASRGTIMGGNAVIIAAEKVKKRIFNVIKKDLQVKDIEETIWKDGIISRKEEIANSKPIKFEKAAGKAYCAGENLSAYGWYNAPDVSWDEETGQGNAYFTYVYGAHVADIRIDTSTGKIDVKNITAAHDVGKVLNKLGAEGQVYGGVTQGFGYAVIEDYNIQDGVVKSDNLDNYLIPTIKDIGNINPILIENEDVDGPFGAKSLGEPTLELTSSAINNALKFATGKHSYELPLTLEKVFLGANLRKPSRQSQIAAYDSCKTHITVVDKQALRLTDVKTLTPHNLKNALEQLSKKDLQILAGGTDMIIELRMKTGKHTLLDISHLNELKNIEINKNEIVIGSGCTFSQILSNKEIQKYFPMLAKACSKIGSLQIRNKGTIGGNIVNAAPCADSFPPLIVYNADFILSSKNGTRRIPADEFIIKNYKTQLNSEEILTEVIIPIPKKKYECSYFQLGRRNAVNITRISIGILISFENSKVEECKIVSGSLFHKPMRIEEIEQIFTGKELTLQSINSIEEPLKKIIEDAIGKRWSSAYKLPVFINMTKDALTEIFERRG